MSKPRYIQIADSIYEQIKSGQFEVDAILPTELELQQHYDVSRITIRKAMQLLVERDLLSRKRGSGTYVKAPKAQHNAFHLSGFVEEISKQGKTPSSKIITFEVIPSESYIAEKLGITKGDEIYSIRRLRLIDNEPEVLEQTFLPVQLFPDLSIGAMRHSKYEFIEKTKGLKIKLSRQSVRAELIDSSISKILNVEKNHPVIRVDSVGELDDGRIFEYSIHYFRVNQYSFDFIAYR